MRHPTPVFRSASRSSFDGHVINAGDGGHAHPTQALLDIYTLIEEFGDLVRPHGCDRRRRPSQPRRALDDARPLAARRAVVLVGPESFLPNGYAVNGISVERDFDAVLPTVDAVVLLRIQRERFAEMPISDREYVAAYPARRAPARPRCAKTRSSCIPAPTTAAWSSTTAC